MAAYSRLGLSELTLGGGHLLLELLNLLHQLRNGRDIDHGELGVGRTDATEG